MSIPDPRDIVGHGLKSVGDAIVPHVHMNVKTADRWIEAIHRGEKLLPEKIPGIPIDCGCQAKKAATVRQQVSWLLQASGRNPETDMPSWVTNVDGSIRITNNNPFPDPEEWFRKKISLMHR